MFQFFSTVWTIISIFSTLLFSTFGAGFIPLKPFWRLFLSSSDFSKTLGPREIAASMSYDSTVKSSRTSFSSS